jgi:hypothetical protein
MSQTTSSRSLVGEPPAKPPGSISVKSPPPGYFRDEREMFNSESNSTGVDQRRVRSCPDCGGQVSNSAVACVHCGKPSRSRPAPPPVLPYPGQGYTYAHGPRLVPGGANYLATQQRPKSSTPSVREVLAVVVGVGALLFSYIALANPTVVALALSLGFIVATFALAHSARRQLDRTDGGFSWLALLASLMAWVSLIIFGFAVYYLVSAVIAGGITGAGTMTVTLPGGHALTLPVSLVLKP